ncbi:MAG: MBL fold metallo-hydrolase, partial [Pseudomonadota bacterium]
MKLRVVILGCGSSGGVPRIGGPDGRGDWGKCDPDEPKNLRSRCSIVVQRADVHGSFKGRLTTLLIDTSPDMRLQLIQNGIENLDAVAITHDHAD